MFCALQLRRRELIPTTVVCFLTAAFLPSQVLNFPFPTPPDAAEIAAAEQTLQRLGALQPDGQLTPLGRAMALLPVSPRHARMLVEVVAGAEPALLSLGVAAAAALSAESPFKKGASKKARLAAAAAAAGGGAAGAEGDAAADGAEDADADADGDDGDADDAAAKRAAGPAGSLAAAAEEVQRAKAKRLGTDRYRELFCQSSDALSAMRALLAFEAAQRKGGASAVAELCARLGLHERVLREMSDLRVQLGQLLVRNAASLARALGARPGASAAEEDIAETLRASSAAAGGERAGLAAPEDSQLTPAADGALRRAIVSGWPDRVARRVKPRERLSEGSTRALRYASIATPEPVFLAPTSAMHSVAPDFIVYTEILQAGTKPFLLAASAVEGAWLADAAPALTALSAPLADPPPRYSAADDEVVCFRTAAFGPASWPLPLRTERHPDAEAACAFFAAALLAGDVAPAFAQLAPKLAAPPATAARPEARGQRRVGDLLHALRRRDVRSRRALLAAWEAQPRFLMLELSQWMRTGSEHAVERMWGEIVSSAKAAAEETRAEEARAAAASARKVERAEKKKKKQKLQK